MSQLEDTTAAERPHPAGAAACSEEGSRVTRHQRIAVAVWDSLFLSVQRVIWNLAPALGARLDDLGHRRDVERARRAGR